MNSGRRGTTGAIIAGGPASRFGGQPKGLELVRGSRIIDRVAESLRPNVDQLMIAANDPAASGWLDDVRVARDVLPGRASAIGIHAALSAAGTNVIVVAWDMPFVPAGLVALLRESLVPGISAVIPRPGGRSQPLCAAYSSTALGPIEAAIRAGELRLTDIVESLPDAVSVEDSELRFFGDPDVVFLNVNTEADLERARVIAGLL